MLQWVELYIIIDRVLVLFYQMFPWFSISFIDSYIGYLSYLAYAAIHSLSSAVDDPSDVFITPLNAYFSEKVGVSWVR